MDKYTAAQSLNGYPIPEDPMAASREIHEHIRRNTEASSYLREMLQELEDRVGPVLRPEMEKLAPGQVGVPTASPTTEHGNAIYNSTQKIELAITRVKSITNRLEV